jgi:hypothetical protein
MNIKMQQHKKKKKKKKKNEVQLIPEVLYISNVSQAVAVSNVIMV